MGTVRRLLPGLLAWALLFPAWPAGAQEAPLRFTTVDRAPFSMRVDGEHRGFSIDLMRAIADDLGREVEFETVPIFSEMLARVQSGATDGAIANISITSAREEVMDFSQPIFASGLQIMVPQQQGQRSILSALFVPDLAFAILAALALLFGGGMLMWLFERRVQPYFDRPPRDALFPSFWWALNLVVNGGFEERLPQSRAGRLFAVVLVISSLFLVSVFVAFITATVTVEALQDSVSSINDLEGRRVGTIEGSTAAAFLTNREFAFQAYSDPVAMFDAFAAGDLDAAFFDGPILAYHVQTDGAGQARLLDRNYRPENYGIALPTGSNLREPINQSLLRLRETGAYDALVDTWFGPAYVQR